VQRDYLEIRPQVGDVTYLLIPSLEMTGGYSISGFYKLTYGAVSYAVKMDEDKTQPLSVVHGVCLLERTVVGMRASNQWGEKRILAPSGIAERECEKPVEL
jgi:hypothetical protein